MSIRSSRPLRILILLIATMAIWLALGHRPPQQPPPIPSRSEVVLAPTAPTITTAPMRSTSPSPTRAAAPTSTPTATFHSPLTLTTGTATTGGVTSGIIASPLAARNETSETNETSDSATPLIATSTPLPSLYPSVSPSPTNSSSPAPPTPPSPAEIPTPAPTTASQPPYHLNIPPIVLANYFPWYDPGTWETGCTSGGDIPRDGPYQSDDPAVIARHIEQARAAGLDGFAVHWFAPGDRTDTNFRQVLNQSPEGFSATVTFLYHILPGANQAGVVEALSHIATNYTGHPRFTRLGGKPVIMFSDMYRIPNADGVRPASDQDVSTALARWAEVRQAVDPNHTMWWVAEGLKPDYLSIFDGLYIYKIDHACCPATFEKAPRWAEWVRAWEQQTGATKLWVGTVMAGWNDLNSAQAHCVDLRVSSEPFARDRLGGDYYAQTWRAVLPTRPDFILLHSFNEWVEGSYIEPSQYFGDSYIQQTAVWVQQFKTQQPASR